DVAELLGRLVDRSLVVRINGSSGSRYRLLETVRGYARDRLAEAGEEEAVRRRLQRYFAGLARHTEPRLYGHSELFAYLGGVYRPDPDRHPGADGYPGEDGPSPRTVTSRDGTGIAYELAGAGPVIVLVGGALNDRRTFLPLLRQLRSGLTAVTYDRRGRGDSVRQEAGSGAGYAVAAEIEDLAAVVQQVGGEAYALGVSSGAVLAAEAAAQGVPLRGLL